ncbi:MAG: 2,3-bisphosphoglycerate-independent phosphoglycerate mutase [Nanoarchaeota archaeon]
MKQKKILALIILDGWGIRKQKYNNAITYTPQIDRLNTKHPHCQSILKASGKAVGLPHNFIGNSEVGHLCIGAGRSTKQMITQINETITNQTFFKNPTLLHTIKHCKNNNSTIHIIGLIQDQGVHAMTHHGIALLDACKRNNLTRIVFHIITDGRDTAPQSALNYLRVVEVAVSNTPGAIIGSVMGRYYAMDRDNHFERTKKAYHALILGKGIAYTSARTAIKAAYKRGETDEFITPSTINYTGITPKDAIIFFNYRADRARQLSKAICEPRFAGFSRPALKAVFVGMIPYYPHMHGHHLFKQHHLKNTLGEVLAQHNITQLRIAETEKYAHVTYFFNGENETPNPGEDRVLIPSPRVARYDTTPAMSARKITQTVLKDLTYHDVYIINFANSDMIGHTGNLTATRKAVQIVDKCVGVIIKKILTLKGIAILCADHGNAEEMQGKWKTSHTTNNVPFAIYGLTNIKVHDGTLADIAPTILEILQIKKPQEMSGTSLIKKR